MSLTNKTFEIYAWRNNTSSIVAVSQENNGRTVRFKLYADDNQIPILNSTKSGYSVFLYTTFSNTSSSFVEGTIDYSTSTVSFDLSSYMLPKRGCYPCFVHLTKGDEIIKFSGMTLKILDGRTDIYSSKVDSNDAFIKWLGKVETLEEMLEEALGKGYLSAFKNAMRFVDDTVVFIPSTIYQLTSEDVANNSPIMISIISVGGDNTRLLRADDNPLINLVTKLPVEITDEQIEVSIDDVLVGLKMTDGGTIKINYYSKNCEDLLSRISQDGGLSQVQYKLRYQSQIDTPTTETYIKEEL